MSFEILHESVKLIVNRYLFAQRTPGVGGVSRRSLRDASTVGQMGPSRDRADHSRRDRGLCVASVTRPAPAHGSLGRLGEPGADSSARTVFPNRPFDGAICKTPHDARRIVVPSTEHNLVLAPSTVSLIASDGSLKEATSYANDSGTASPSRCASASGCCASRAPRFCWSSNACR